MIWLRRVHAWASRWVWVVDGLRGLLLLSFIPFLWPRSRKTQELEGPLVVVRTDGLGDLVLFLGWLGVLRQRHPGRRLLLLVRPVVADFASRLGLADEVIAVDTEALLVGVGARRQLLARLKALGASEVLSPMIGGDVFWADALVWCMGARRSVGVMEASAWGPLRWMRARIYTELVSVNDAQGMYEINRRILHGFDNGMDGAKPRPLRRILGKGWPRGNHFVIFPGANFEYRRWPLGRFMELGARIQALTGWRPVICGGAHELDLAAEAVARLPESENLVGRQNLEGLLETLGSARLVLCNDTGPAHLASALGTPLAVFVGGGQPGLFFPHHPSQLAPEGPQIVFEQARFCQGCEWHCPFSMDPRNPRPCISEIGLEEVWDRLKVWLEPFLGRGESSSSILGKVEASSASKEL